MQIKEKEMIYKRLREENESAKMVGIFIILVQIHIFRYLK